MKGQPFFFDQNNFDDDSAMKDQDENAPPPPEFTAEELEAARRKSFEEGKKAGFEESQSGLSKQILLLAQQIDRTGKQLLLAEDERAKIHETEAVCLSLRIMNKLFPDAYGKLALEELKQVLLKTFQGQLDHKEITIEIHPDAESEIGTYLAEVAQDSHSAFRLQSNPALGMGECRVLWTDGGMLYDMEGMAEKIAFVLAEALAAQGVNPHDEGPENTADQETGDNP